ncbi:MAG: M14 family metallopeptidase [Proteobacteria bacterium]|nr:M14 family metallopeptidase [Pseudomonadota bacterium]
MLNIVEKFDDEILGLPAHRLHEKLPGPTLLHLKGKKEPCLFLSVLLHGNENSGWEVVKNILLKYKTQQLPRTLSIFIGNVKAARYKKRRLENQLDFNRTWCRGEADENKMMLSIIEHMRKRKVFASIDIHNNNGLNPHYGCINKLDKPFLKLAKEFSSMVIYFIRPFGVQSLAFSDFCPAITLETGLPGDEYGINLTTKFVDHVLNMTSLDINEDVDKEIDLYHTIGVIKLPGSYDFSFDGKKADIQFIKGIEGVNFIEISSDTLLCRLKRNIDRPLIAMDEDGKDIFDDFFTIKEDGLYTKKEIMPAMLTTDINIVRQDCLCYLMEHYDIKRGEKTTNSNSSLWK